MPIHPSVTSGITDLLEMLKDPLRLKLVFSLVEQETSVEDLERRLHASQSHLSQHLRALKFAGIVASRRDGRRNLYSLTNQNAGRLIVSLHTIFCAKSRP